MHTIYIDEKPYLLPSRMEELSPAQLKKIMWVLSLDKTPIDKAKLIVFVQSMSLSFLQRLKFVAFFLLRSNDIEKADIIFCTQSFAQFSDFTEQKLLKIGVNSVLLYGPSSALANCTFWEFVKAEKYMSNYLSTQDQDWLDKLVATLYRPKKKDYSKKIHDDIRQPFTDQIVTYHLPDVRKSIDIGTKLAILKWFDSCRKLLARNFPLIFPKSSQEEDDGNPLAKISQGKGSSDWISLIGELAGSMDNYDKIGNTNLYIAFTDISHRIRKSQEAQQNARKRH
jgi:hypothetical protein